MAILKTYSISGDVIDGAVNSYRLDCDIINSDYITGYDGFIIDGDTLNIMGDSISNIGSPSDEALLDLLIENHDGINPYAHYKILLDINESNNKDVKDVNYKIELNSGVEYTSVFYIHFDGAGAGCLDKTEYYRDYIDDDNRGTLILIVEETYVMDASDPTLPYTARPCLNRTKTWKWVDDSGNIDQVNVKIKSKQYNTRRKRKIEAERRRGNVIEQLIDHVGLGGVLSGAFVDADDAYDKLTSLQELHANAFTGWYSSGRGSLVDVTENDATTTWLDTVIPDNPTNQFMIPWIIGLDFRQYIQDKLKGNIK